MMKNGRRSEARASAASYNKRQPRRCSRRLARGCPPRKPKRKPSTKTKTSNENRSSCSFSLVVEVLRAAGGEARLGGDAVAVGGRAEPGRLAGEHQPPHLSFPPPPP